MPVGSEVTVHLALPAQGLSRGFGRARVRRAGERDTAIEFVRDEGPARIAIEKLIEAMRVDWERAPVVAHAPGCCGPSGVLEPPVPRQGARRVWSDSHGALWITGWNSGDLFRYDSKAKTWARWRLPGNGPQPYAVYVDETGLGQSIGEDSLHRMCPVLSVIHGRGSPFWRQQSPSHRACT